MGREAARRMVPRGRGTILFTGATASVRGGAGFGAFAGAKHALRALAQSMAREFVAAGHPRRPPGGRRRHRHRVHPQPVPGTLCDEGSAGHPRPRAHRRRVLADPQPAARRLDARDRTAALVGDMVSGGRLLRRGGLALALLVVAGGVWLRLAPPELIRVGAGYSAKIVCSSVFISGRDAHQVLQQDVQSPGHPLLRLMRVSVDREAKVVRAGLFGFAGGGLAVWREGTGCASVPDGDLARAAAHVAPAAPAAAPRASSWPEGDAVDPAAPALAALLADEGLAGPGTARTAGAAPWAHRRRTLWRWLHARDAVARLVDDQDRHRRAGGHAGARRPPRHRARRPVPGLGRRCTTRHRHRTPAVDVQRLELQRKVTAASATSRACSTWSRTWRPSRGSSRWRSRWAASSTTPAAAACCWRGCGRTRCPVARRWPGRARRCSARWACTAR